MVILGLHNLIVCKNNLYYYEHFLQKMGNTNKTKSE